MLAREEMVWSALADPRSEAERAVDAEIAAECRDDPDPLSRLHQDAIAVCSEYFARVKQRNNRAVPSCPGCEALAFEGSDLVEQKIVRLVRTELRQKRRRRLPEVQLDLLPTPA